MSKQSLNMYLVGLRKSLALVRAQRKELVTLGGGHEHS